MLGHMSKWQVAVCRMVTIVYSREIHMLNWKKMVHLVVECPLTANTYVCIQPFQSKDVIVSV